MATFKPGQTVYYISNNIRISKGEIIRSDRDFSMVRYNQGAIRLRNSRLYETEEAAYAALPPEVRDKKEQIRRQTGSGPYNGQLL